MSIVSRSKEDKKLTLLTYMGMRACVCVAEPISTSTPQIVLVKRESNDSQKNNEENKGEVTI